MVWLKSFLIWRVAFTMLMAALPCSSFAQNVQISSLSDPSFGTISNFSVDQIHSQNVCIFVRSRTGAYTITATGGGSAGEFVLASGGNNIPFEVQWTDSINQRSGQQLFPGVAFAGTTPNYEVPTCDASSPESVSLITVIRQNVIRAARAGNYSGTLMLLLAPR